MSATIPAVMFLNNYLVMYIDEKHTVEKGPDGKEEKVMELSLKSLHTVIGDGKVTSKRKGKVTSIGKEKGMALFKDGNIVLVSSSLQRQAGKVQRILSYHFHKMWETLAEDLIKIDRPGIETLIKQGIIPKIALPTDELTFKGSCLDWDAYIDLLEAAGVVGPPTPADTATAAAPATPAAPVASTATATQPAKTLQGLDKKEKS